MRPLLDITQSIAKGLLQETFRRFTPQDKQRSMTSDSIIRMGDLAEDFNSTSACNSLSNA
ncbi:MAG: hypothetical protein QGF31_03430 [Nitrospinota bacterium]|nr:hypothetical protein [Nitrospinota bacterium]